MRIGPYQLSNNLALAPMAGVTDLPFRNLCRKMGAGLLVSEMVTSDTRLWHSRKSRQRLPHQDEPGPVSVQIAGGDAQMLAQAARSNVALGAQIIDINMGCPAKKVCRKAAGSALLRDEKLVQEILQSVVQAVDVPVTLKIRTGWSGDERNAVNIARMAEQSGIQALAIHGRTRACKFNGQAEYDTIAEVVSQVQIPVYANGDITDAKKAKYVLDYTGAGGIMVGRAAQGNPWLFREILFWLESGSLPPAPCVTEVSGLVMGHLEDLHTFYGEYSGTRIARKHLGWYMQSLPGGESFRKHFNTIECANEQLDAVEQFFQHLSQQVDRIRFGQHGSVSADKTEKNVTADGALAA